MANFLGNLGAALKGQQDYKTWLDQQEAAKLRLEADKQQLAEIKDLSAQNKKQRDRQPDVDQGIFDYLSQSNQGIPPPPPEAPQAPPPGQASVPMTQPNAQYGQKPIGPQMGMPPQAPQQAPRPPMPQQGMPPPPQGQMPPQGPPQAPQGQPQAPQGQQMPPPGQPPVPPYRTVGGPAPQAGPQGIPPPPPQQPGQPAPNSMSLKDAAQFIKARGITDPTTSVQILEKLAPYLNNEAKQEAAMLKMQLDQQNKMATLEEKKRQADLISEDKNASIDQRRDAAQASAELKKTLGMVALSIQQQNANTRKQDLQRKVSAGNSLDKDDLAFMAQQYWAGDKSVTTGLGRNPAALTALRSEITKQGKAMGKSGSDVALATAEFEGLKAGERALGTRTANVGMAVNEANLLSDLALKASGEWSRAGIKTWNDLQKYAQGKTASPELRKFVAANNSFVNAYARAISPSGVPTVSDKDHAREMLEVSFSKGDYAATIEQLKNEMEAAKQAPQAAKQELRNLAKAGTGPQEGPTQIKDAADYAKLPSGAEYITPDGQHKRKP